MKWNLQAITSISVDISLDNNPPFNHIYTSPLPFTFRPSAQSHLNESMTITLNVSWILMTNLLIFSFFEYLLGTYLGMLVDSMPAFSVLNQSVSLYVILVTFCLPHVLCHNFVLLQFFLIYYPLSYLSWSWEGVLAPEQPDCFLSLCCWSIGSIFCTFTYAAVCLLFS